MGRRIRQRRDGCTAGYHAVILVLDDRFLPPRQRAARLEFENQAPAKGVRNKHDQLMQAVTRFELQTHGNALRTLIIPQGRQQLNRGACVPIGLEGDLRVEKRVHGQEPRAAGR